jgi:tetratricopeptide (TPR) repeat protein
MCRCRQLLRLPLLAVALFLVIPSPSLLARGKGEDPAAIAERAKGTVALNLGRYEEAIEHLSQAYALTQDPTLLFSLAQAYRLSSKPEKSLAAYSAFLRAAPASPKYRAQVERAASEIEALTSALLNRPAERPTQEKRLDNLMTAPTPVAGAQVEPPPAPETQQTDEPAPAAVEPPLVLAPPPPSPLPPPALSLTSQENAPPPPSRVYSKWWFWTSVGVALAAGGVATWWFTRPENQTPPSTYGALRVLP